MPYYEYHCPANGCIVEVRHSMGERLETWGALADVAGRDPGDTPSDAPVERLMSVASVGSSGGVSPAGGPGPGPGGCGPGCACARPA